MPLIPVSLPPGFSYRTTPSFGCEFAGINRGRFPLLDITLIHQLLRVHSLVLPYYMFLVHSDSFVVAYCHALVSATLGRI